MIKSKKTFSLPNRPAKEATGGAVDISSVYEGGTSRTRFRTDFEEQARQLKEKIALGPTPVRIKRPVNTLSLSSKGTLKGDIEVLEPQEGSETRVDLSHAAKSVYESTKRPVFKKQSKQSVAPLKDERESTNKQPMEAVACETAKYNRREVTWIHNKDIRGISSAMATGNIAKARGKYLLSMIEDAATESSDSSFNATTSNTIIPRSLDMGKVIEEDIPATESSSASWKDQFIIAPELASRLAASDNSSTKKNFAAEQFDVLKATIDTEIGDDLGGTVSYSSHKPMKGSITKLSKDSAKVAKGVLEHLGLSVRELSAKESVSLLFNANESLISRSWNALVATGSNKEKVEQLTISSDAADETQVTAYLESKYGKGSVYKVSTSPIQ